MKDKILVFIIGFLVGAIITASGFLIYQNVNKDNSQISSEEQTLEVEKSDGEEPPEMQMMERPDGEEPPEKPNGEEPPEMQTGETLTEKIDDTGNSNNRKEPPSKNKTSTSETETN